MSRLVCATYGRSFFVTSVMIYMEMLLDCNSLFDFSAVKSQEAVQKSATTVQKSVTN
jgi:hypothetical protein